MRNLTRNILFAAVIAACTMPAQAQDQTGQPHREFYEWTDVWIPGGNNTDKPRILLIGNSITRGYQPKVEKMMADRAYVARFSTSKSVGDPALLDELEAVMKNTRFDIVQFNNGLHGMEYTDEEYERAFPELLALIRKYAPDAYLIWANFTPLYQAPEMTEITEHSLRGDARNEIALRLLKDENVEISDLHSVMVGHPEYYLQGDGSHPREAGYEALARKVVEVLDRALSKIGK